MTRKLMLIASSSIPNNIEFRWRTAGTTYVAVNDGSVGVNFPGSVSGSDRSSKMPVASFEVKKLTHSPSRRFHYASRGFAIFICLQSTAV